MVDMPKDEHKFRLAVNLDFSLALRPYKRQLL